MKTTRKRIIISGAILAVVALFPWKSTVAPDLSVHVFDEVGNPASGVVVRQDWEYFSIGSWKYKEYSQTDENGYVAFPKRSARTNLLSKILSLGLEVLTAGHYGMGAHVMIWVWQRPLHLEFR
jgi:hypothetical protein